MSTPPTGTAESAPRTTRSLPRRLTDLVMLIVLIAILAVLCATVLIPLVMGWTPLTVTTGSMRPTIPPGSQVIVKPLDPVQTTTLEKGQVITFMPDPDSDELVTHRIIGVERSDGVVSYTTRGDANGAPDPEPAESKQVRALVRYHVPYVGYAAQLLDQGQKRTGIYVLAGALAAYAVFHLVRDNLPSRRKADEDEGRSEETDRDDVS